MAKRSRLLRIKRRRFIAEEMAFQPRILTRRSSSWIGILEKQLLAAMEEMQSTRKLTSILCQLSSGMNIQILKYFLKIALFWIIWKRLDFVKLEPVVVVDRSPDSFPARFLIMTNEPLIGYKLLSISTEWVASKTKNRLSSSANSSSSRSKTQLLT